MFERFHFKCAKLDRNGNNCDWFCSPCMQTLFPFNGIENDEEFVNTIYCYGHLPISVDVLNSLGNTFFNPFVCERKRAVVNNRDIDPDINYFNTEVTNNCTYYLTEEFNDIVRTQWKPSVQLGYVFNYAYEL